MVPMIDLVNAVDLILKDYENIKGALKEVGNILTDIYYIKDTLEHLESLFGDEQ